MLHTVGLQTRNKLCTHCYPKNNINSNLQQHYKDIENRYQVIPNIIALMEDDKLHESKYISPCRQKDIYQLKP